MSKSDKFANASSSLKELRATVSDLRNTYRSFICGLYYTNLIKDQTNINKKPTIIKSNSIKMKDSTFSDFAGLSLLVISFFIFVGGILLIFSYIDETNKNHIVETSETIEVNIVNPGNKQIKVNLPDQANIK